MKLARRFYGYGIVGKSGKPWWDEACVCKDRGPLQETVGTLNEAVTVAGHISGKSPTSDQFYRVVRLFYETRGKR